MFLKGKSGSAASAHLISLRGSLTPPIAFILNNSGASLHTVATKDEESVSIEGAIIPEIMDALLRSLPELKALLEQNAADVKASD